MKKIVGLLALGLLVAVLFAGCAKPEAEIANAEAAINAAIKDGANVYSKAELQQVQNDLRAAMDEVNAQSKKLFKSYGKSKQLLLAATQKAEEVKAGIPARKEKAKNDAITALGEVRTVLDSTKVMLDKAPKGKGTKADLEAMTADFVGLEDMYLKAQSKIQTEDFFGALDQARLIKQRAAGIANQVQQAIDKVKGKR